LQNERRVFTHRNQAWQEFFFVEHRDPTADFCTGSIVAGGDGGEGEAMVEPVHGVVEVLEGRLPEVFAMASPRVVNADGAAAENAQDQDGIAVAHAAGIFAAAYVKPLVETALNVPIAADALQEFVAACRIRLEAANVDAGFFQQLAGSRDFVALVLDGDLSAGAAVNYKNIKLSYALVYRTKEFDEQEEEQVFGTVS
jgi:hypothetical protein